MRRPTTSASRPTAVPAGLELCHRPGVRGRAACDAALAGHARGQQGGARSGGGGHRRRPPRPVQLLRQQHQLRPRRSASHPATARSRSPAASCSPAARAATPHPLDRDDGRRPAQRPGSFGLVSGVGMHMTKHVFAVYGTEPGPVEVPDDAPVQSRAEAEGPGRSSTPLPDGRRSPPTAWSTAGPTTAKGAGRL